MRLSEIYKKAGVSVLCPENLSCSQEPRPYQYEDLSDFLSWSRSSNFSEVGTGKSLVSYLYIMYKLLKGRKVVIVMPPSLIPQYQEEFNKIITGHDYKMVSLCLPPANRALLLKRTDISVVFISYGLFTKEYKKLLWLGFRVLIADESQAIKNIASKNFLVVYRFLSTGNTDFMEMSATPCTGQLRDAYAHILLKLPEAYTNLAHFDRLHTIYQTIGNRPKIVGYRDQLRIQNNLNFHAKRRIAREVLPMKEMVMSRHKVELSKVHKSLYTKLLRERMLELGDQLLIADNASKLRQMALQIVTNVTMFTDKDIDDEPLNCLKTIHSSLPNGTKLLVFCVYRQTILHLARHFSSLNPALIYGGSDVPKNVKKFQTDNSCLIAFANYRSGGAGFNLQYCCHNVLFYELLGVPSDYTQAVGRVDRSGQEEVVNCWIFDYYQTLTSLLIKSAVSRSKDIQLVMQDKTAFLQALCL